MKFVQTFLIKPDAQKTLNTLMHIEQQMLVNSLATFKRRSKLCTTYLKSNTFWSSFSRHNHTDLAFKLSKINCTFTQYQRQNLNALTKMQITY